MTASRSCYGIQAGEKVFQTFRLEVTNTGGHSARPLEDNAIYHLADGISRLAKFDFPFKVNEVTRPISSAPPRLKRASLRRTKKRSCSSRRMRRRSRVSTTCRRSMRWCARRASRQCSTPGTRRTRCRSGRGQSLIAVFCRRTGRRDRRRHWYECSLMTRYASLLTVLPFRHPRRRCRPRSCDRLKKSRPKCGRARRWCRRCWSRRRMDAFSTTPAFRLMASPGSFTI